MRRVMQEKKDDCLAACVASLLEVPLAGVPNYCPRSKDGEDLQCRMQAWLAKNFGLSLVTVLRPDGVPLSDWICRTVVSARFIACVPVNRDAWHAVIAGIYGRRIRLLHDPGGHSRIRLRLTNDVSFLVPIRPTAPRVPMKGKR